MIEQVARHEGAKTFRRATSASYHLRHLNRKEKRHRTMTIIPNLIPLTLTARVFSKLWLNAV